jgi:hypothetical protein
MFRILISLLVSRAFAAAHERSVKPDIDQQTNDFISSDLYRRHVGPEFPDVERFVHASELSGSLVDESDFFSVDVAEHISRIRPLFQQVPDDREVLTIPNWNAQYKPQIHRALYEFHTDIVSRTTSGDSTLANFVKQLHFFVTVFDPRTVDEIFEVKAKILRDLDLVEFVRMSGNYAENRPRQLATFIAYAENQFDYICDTCYRVTISRDAADAYKFDTLSGLLAIARGLYFLAPDCDLEPLRDEIRRAMREIRLVPGSKFVVPQTRYIMNGLRSFFRECTSRL